MWMLREKVDGTPRWLAKKGQALQTTARRDDAIQFDRREQAEIFFDIVGELPWDIDRLDSDLLKDHVFVKEEAA
jgi:hypothetical protein